MKVCGHEHITVEGCDTCYIVKLKKRVDKLLATEYKRLDRIAKLEGAVATAEAANHYNALHRDKLVAENQRLRELFDRWGASGDVVAASYAMQAKLVRGGE